MNLDNKICKSDDFMLSELDDGLVMMSLENNSYYGLDEIGKRVIELSENPIKISDVVNKLTQEYDVSDEQCEKDLFSLLEDLKKEGIITVD